MPLTERAAVAARVDPLAGVALPPDRHFGLLMAGVSLLAGGYCFWKGPAVAGWPLLGLAALLLLLTALAPQALAPANRLWMRLGLLMGAIVNPLVLGLMFFGMITPLALAMRLAGRDVMRRRAGKGQDSYWIERDPPGPKAESLKQQF